MSEIEKYYNGEIHVDFEEDKPLLTKEEAEEYYNKLWLENKELIQENIDKLNTKRFALEMELIDKNKEIENQKEVINGMIDNEEKYCLEINKLKSIIKEVREYVENNSLYEQDYDYDYEENLYEYPPSDEQARKDILSILDKGSDKE